MTSPLLASQQDLYARTFALDDLAAERNDQRLDVREND